MSKLPPPTSKKLIKILKSFGFQLDHATGSHFIFYNPETKKTGGCPLSQKEFTKRNINEYFKRSRNY